MGRLRATDYRGFYELLQEQIAGYSGEFDDILLLVPDFFRLLTNLLEDARVPKNARLLISAAIAYFVAPYDVQPEEVYGPLGYLDDLFLCTFVLRELRSSIPDEVIKGAWEAEFDLDQIADSVYEKSRESLGDKTDAILHYVGLR